MSVNNHAAQFRRQLDANIEKMVQNLAGIVRSAKITTETESYQQSVQISIHTINLLQAAESLMRQIQELKLSVILQDLEALNSETDQNIKLIEERSNSKESGVRQLSNDVNAQLESTVNTAS
mmetsp:Transcript_38083/g.50185  ORF Transcript_38083/g.50185 Transcript_38083/m.50185 type:complete len:122 (+) Transcript_38083:65-430(+)